MVITVAAPEPLAAAPPGFGRAYASVTVLVKSRGVLVPGAFALWRPFTPGTDDQYPGALFGDPYSEVTLSFPQRADANGMIEVWAPEPVRIEFRAWIDGYAPVQTVVDLLFTEDTQASVDLAAHIADPNAHPQYLTVPQADARYYTQTQADARFVNVTGDRMTGQLTLGQPPETFDRLGLLASYIGNPAVVFGSGSATADVALSRFGPALLSLLGTLRPWTTRAYDLGATNAYWRAGYFQNLEVTDVTIITGRRLEVSPDTDNTLEWRNNGLYGSPTGGGISQEDADLRYLQLTGGTLTGTLFVNRVQARPGSPLVISAPNMIQVDMPTDGYIVPIQDLSETIGLPQNRWKAIYTGGLYADSFVLGGMDVATQLANIDARLTALENQMANHLHAAGDWDYLAGAMVMPEDIP